MKAALCVGLLFGIPSVASSQTSTSNLRGATPAQLMDKFGFPHLVKVLSRENTPGTETSRMSKILDTRNGEWVYDDNTQPCHLTQVRFVFRDGKVESWTRFVPVTFLGGPDRG